MQRCPNCQAEIPDPSPACPNCGWQPKPYMPPPRWQNLLAMYAGLVAVFGACGYATYVGIGTLFGFGPLGGFPIARILAFVVLGIYALGMVVRRLKARR